MNSYSNYKFIFVNGLHRSGTSVLYRLLSLQKKCSGFTNTGVPEDEGQHLQSVFKAAKYFGGPGKFGFDRGSFLDSSSNLISNINREKLFNEWSKYWDLSKDFLVEKSPPNIVRTTFLQEMFSNSYFITIIRHPIAVSFATQKWSKNSLEDLFQHWLICNDKFKEDERKLTKTIIFKYEDFTSNHSEIVNDISKLLKFQLLIPTKFEIKDKINDKYFELWDRYKNSFWTKRKAQILINKYEDKFNLYGYSLK